MHLHVFGVLSYCPDHRALSFQDTLDPSKDDDIILALIIAAASNKHRDTPRMQSLQRRALVGSLVTWFRSIMY